LLAIARCRKLGANGSVCRAPDVTIIDAVADVVPCGHAPDSIAGSYASRTGWDPRDEDAPHVCLTATPASMQAWNSLAEIDGRTIMRNGQWTAV
jgi:hypothetical protein